MLEFPKQTINYIKNLLKRQQRQVEKNLQKIEKDDPLKEEGLAETSEPGTDSSLADSHTKTVVLEDTLKKTSTGIREALLKIQKGTYGKCEKCGKQIGIARLLAMPTAKYCLSCSKKVSK